MNLFFKKLTGKLQSTEKFEVKMDEVAANVLRYRQVEKSNDLKEYQQLQPIVTEPAFIAQKNVWIKTKYKDTECYKMLRDLKKLQNNKDLQIFLEVRDSAILKDYLLFRNSPDHIQLTDKKLVAQSHELKRLKDFEKSKKYKVYSKMTTSKLPDELARLKEVTATEQFQRENVFWSNANRWQTTEAYKQELRYKQLSEMPDIVFFNQQDIKQIEFYESWKLIFDDEFTWKKLSDSNWASGFSYKNKALKRNHSFAKELQANNEGKNVGTMNGILTLLTKQESVVASAWDEKLGFINKQFSYTSDVVTTADSFRQKGGLFVAKVRCEGAINHTIWLGSDEKLPLLKIFHFNGKNIYVGQATKTGVLTEKLTGICPKNYFIFALAWENNQLIWYINNLEVYRSVINVPKEELYLGLSSFITSLNRPQEGKMEIDWIRVYENK